MIIKEKVVPVETSRHDKAAPRLALFGGANSDDVATWGWEGNFSGVFSEEFEKCGKFEFEVFERFELFRNNSSFSDCCTYVSDFLLFFMRSSLSLLSLSALPSSPLFPFPPSSSFTWGLERERERMRVGREEEAEGEREWGVRGGRRCWGGVLLWRIETEWTIGGREGEGSVGEGGEGEDEREGEEGGFCNPPAE